MNEIAELRCKNCGGALNIEEASDGVIKCKYCKSLFAVHKKETLPEAVAQLRIAENELDNNSFDRALTAYKRAAEIDGSEPQAYYGMALARHKVQYLKAVKDSSGERVSYLQPICHEYKGESFTADESYKKALELATGRQRAYYESKGEEIDYIAREFERLSASGLDYDSFICVKVTDDRTGLRTLDCKDADDIYYYLKRKGYKPFFSETEIGKKSGADYEAHILYALYRAECMVVVCHDERYLETAWVKNEYTRFLNLIRGEIKDSDAVTIAFSGNVIERLPGRSGRLQGIDLRRGDSLEKIREFVESHTPEARAKREEEKERRAHESERLKRETEELKRQIEEQNRRFEEQLKELAKAKTAEPAKTVDVSGLSDEEMLDMIERAQREREEKARRKSEAIKAAELARRAEEERKRKEEEERVRKEREKRAAEERAKKEEEENKQFAHKYYKISDGVLKSYNGQYKANSYFGKIETRVFPIPKEVLEIEDGAFYSYDSHNEIGRINILGDVKRIGTRAFERCRNLEYINIPESIEIIEHDAFKDCKIKYNYDDNCDENNGQGFRGAYLGNKDNPYVILMHIIGKAGFSLSRSYSVNKKTKIINCYAFKGCTQLTDVTVSDSVRRINYGAFENCTALKSINIPESVQYIGNGVFKNCKNLKTIYIPSSVTYLADDAFMGCLLESVTISPSNPKYKFEDGCIVEKDTGKIIAAFNPDRAMQGVIDIDDNAFANSAFSEIIIPEGVETIGENAFEGCVNLVKVTIPSTVCEIKAYAFKNCTALRSIEIPDGVNSIGESVFQGCKSLTSVVLPKGLTCIETALFAGCERLASIIIPSSVESIGSDAFGGCSSLTEIKIPDGVVSLSGFSGCTALQYISIPESVNYIGSCCFAGCVGLESITIPASVREIGEETFYGCVNLKELSVPFIGKDIETPSELGYFFGKKKSSYDEKKYDMTITTEEYNFPNTLKSLYVESGTIVEEAFKNRTIFTRSTRASESENRRNGEREFIESTSVIENLTLGSDVVEIKRFAFAHARSLKRVTLPKTLKKQINEACVYRYETFDAFKGKWKSVKVDERKHIKFIFT